MSFLSNLTGCLGEKLTRSCGNVIYIASMIVEFHLLAVKRPTWSHPVRQRLTRQILFSGVEAVPFTLRVAVVIGVSLLLQCVAWLEFTGNMDTLGSLIPIIVVREGAPFFASFIIIGASAAAMTCELANMKTSGEIALLESQGINIFRLIVIPRMLGLAVSALGLGIMFSFAALFATAIGMYFLFAGGENVRLLLDSVLHSLSIRDLANLAGKCLFVGLITGAICCCQGLGVSGATTVVPQAVNAAMMKSILALSVVTAAFSILNYV